MHQVGIDIIEIARIEQAIARWGETFLRRIYTESERSLYHKNASSLAVRFAGKEAAIKALRAPGKSIGWRDIEILSEPDGKPTLRLYGEAQNQATALGVDSLAVSLSHCKEYAIALVSAGIDKSA